MEIDILSTTTKSSRVLVFLGIVLALCSGGRAQNDPYTVGVGMSYGVLYPAGQWVPLWLNCENNTAAPMQGYGVIPVSDEVGSAAIRVPIEVPAHARVRAVGYGYFVPPAVPRGKKLADVEGAPLTIPSWVSHDGGQLARQPIVAHAIGAKEADSSDPMAVSYLLSLSDGANRENAGSDAYEGLNLADLLSSVSGYHVQLASVGDSLTPREAIGYSPCRFVALDKPDPDELDEAQRAALLEHIRMGGVLILAEPAAQSKLASSWLAPYLPVQIVGHRQASQVQASATSPLQGRIKLCDTLELCEAVAGDGQVVLRDDQFVHAAFKCVGLGRVVFTSFPLGSAAATDATAQAVWKQLLGSDPLVGSWRGTKLQDQRQQLLQPMIGKVTTPWAVAGGIAGGYVLLIVLVQCVTRAENRPRAFVVASVVSLAIAAALVGVTAAKRSASPLASARLAVLDLGNGGGVHREVLALQGEDDPDLSLQARDENVLIRPVLSQEQEGPTLQVNPFQVARAGVWAERVKRVWEVSQPLDAGKQVEAVGVFGPEGLKLSVNNHLGQALRAPLLVWGHSRFSLSDLAGGQSTAVAGRANRNGRADYTNAALLSSESTKLRGQILRASLESNGMGPEREPHAPLLAAWLDQGQVPPLLECSKPVQVMRTQAMVRLPVRLLASDPGTRVQIDSAFTHMATVGQTALPYDLARQEWVPSSQDAQWVFAFIPPREIGPLKPLQVTIEAEPMAPQQTITVRREQCADGKISPNPNGAIVAEWKNAIERQTVRFACQPADADANGVVWLWVQIQGPGVSAGGVPAAWSFRDFAVSYEAEVAAGGEGAKAPESK